VVIFSRDDPLEAANRLLERDEHTRAAGEHFGDVERLRQKALDLPRPGNRQFVFLR
jgi:hypothetical protein